MMQQIEAVSSVYKAIKQNDAKSMSNDRNICQHIVNISELFNHIQPQSQVNASVSRHWGRASQSQKVQLREICRNVPRKV